MSLLTAGIAVAAGQIGAQDGHCACRRGPRLRVRQHGTRALPAPAGDALDAGADQATRRSATTDSTGRYEIPDVPEGEFVIGFFHPKLDSLGIEAPIIRSTMPRRGTRGIDLAVPSALSVIATSCGRRAATDSLGFVAGYVLHPDGAPRDGASVLAKWSEIVIDRGGARASTRQATATTSVTGWFGLCGIPHGALVLVQVTTSADTGSFVEIEVPEEGVLTRTIYLGSDPIARDTRDETGRDTSGVVTDSIAAERVVVAPTPAPGGLLPRGSHVRLNGVVSTAFGEPIAGARVRIWGSTYTTTTNSEGVYALADVPAGTHTLEVRKIGYVPSRTAVDVLSGDSPTRADVAISEFPTVIDTVRVMATRPHSALSAGSFEYRRRLGFGTFLDADQIERRLPQQFTDLIRNTRGVLLSTNGTSSATVAMEGNSLGVACEPLIVLDGQRVPLEGMNINELIPAAIVRAVEIYPRRMEAPPEYQTADCGSIVVWTGPRGWLAKRGKAKQQP
ncbi:MAG: carboxypeptidase regulatory-like domain-containing protein [Gemmatimonadaceae bacterium]